MATAAEAAGAAANWQPTGEGLELQRARAVAEEHNVPLDVVLKGCFVEAIDGRNGFIGLHEVEDHVIVPNQGRDFIKFAQFTEFRAACMVDADQRPPQARLVVMVMPYADLDSCDKLQELDTGAGAPPQFGYESVEIANYNILLWKKRDQTAIKDEKRKCRELMDYLETTARQPFAPTQFRRLALPMGDDRKIAKERLMRAHLDAKQYGDAHQLLLTLDKPRHNTIFRSPGCYDPCSNPPGDQTAQKLHTSIRLEAYKRELDVQLGRSAMDVYPEQADILRMEAQYKFRTEIAEARRQIKDIIDNAKLEIQRVTQQLHTAAHAEARSSRMWGLIDLLHPSSFDPLL